jgi:arylformamidase
VSNFLWSDATDEDVDLQYSPSRFALRPLDEYLVEYATLSQPYRNSSLTVPGQPLLVYIHGGYWQRLSAADSLFNAPDALAHGVSLHAVEYTLAPHATVAQIIDECVVDVQNVLNTLQPSRVVVAGCSAGAHLVAMCARHASLQGRLHAVALLSGIYDVRPIVRTPTNDPLGLTNETAADISPQLLAPVASPPHALLAVGQHESAEFIRQNREYGELLQRNGAQVTIDVVENRDHFNLPYDLLRKGTRVGDWVLAQLKG